MAEPRHTSPLENIPPVAKVAQASLDALFERSHKQLLLALQHAQAQSWIRPRQLAALRSQQARAVLRKRVVVAAERAESKLLRSHALGTVLHGGAAAVGGLVNAYNQYEGSTATTQTGKLVDAALAGGVDVIIGETVLAVPDAALHFGLVAAGIDPRGLTIADNFNAGIHATVALSEGLITGDTTAAATYQERAAKGEYGPPAQALAALGDDIAKEGIGATLAADLSYYWHGCRFTH